jgi:hypothetical protein
LARSVTLAEKELVVDDTATGVMILELRQLDEVRGVPGQQGLPKDERCQIQTADLGNNARKRLRYMRRMSRRVSQEKEFDELGIIVDQINLERSRIAFGSRAMAATEIAKQNAKTLLDHYS